jgi:hypothetical protein
MMRIVDGQRVVRISVASLSRVCVKTEEGLDAAPPGPRGECERPIEQGKRVPVQ